MRAIVIERKGAPVAKNVRLVEDWPQPVPGPGQVLVRSEAAALNHLDLWIGRGLPGLDLKYPCISGSDGAGVVSAVGAGVAPGWAGRRVIVNAAVPAPEAAHPDIAPAPADITMIGEHTPGTLAEYFLAPVSNVADIGAGDAAEAAAFGLVHLTAWRMLRTRAGLQPGHWVLVSGIGGGVALACLNIAVHFGAIVIVTSRHQDKLDRALALGARHGVLDRGDDWSREVRRLTGGRGVDICADSVGRAIHGPCLKSLARGGVFVTCGCTSGPDGVTDLARIFWNQLAIMGSTMGDMSEFRQVVALLRGGALRPVIDSTYPPQRGAEAFARLESSDQFGKVVIDWR